MIKKLLLYCFITFSYCGFATNYYTMGGGLWSTTSYSGPNNTAAPTACNAGDNIYVNVGCTVSPTTLPNCISAGETYTGCYSLSFSNVAGNIYIEGNGFLMMSSISFANTGKMTLSGNAYALISGSVITTMNTNTVVVQVDNNAIFHWRGSITLYRQIQGTGGVKCCGSFDAVNDGVQFFGSVFGRTGTLSCGDGILPVLISSFDVKSYNERNILEWTTTMELNNSHFVVEKGTKNGFFEEIGTVKSEANHGTSYEAITYQFIDYTDRETTVYRLKQVDIDGKISFFYSKPITNELSNFISLFPNPSDNEFEIHSSFDIQKIEIYDLEGKLQQIVKSGDKTKNIHIKSDLPTGSYLVKIYDENYKTTFEKLTIF